MENKQNIIYKESQNFTILIVLSLILLVVFAIAGLFNFGPFGIGFALFWLAILLFFYKLEIIITPEKSYLKFGVGLIKRTIATSDLKVEDAKTIDVPWYWGMGIRLTPHGLLYNTKPGEALLIPTHSGGSKLFASTAHSEQIIEAIKQVQNTNSNT